MRWSVVFREFRRDVADWAMLPLDLRPETTRGWACVILLSPVLLVAVLGAAWLVGALLLGAAHVVGLPIPVNPDVRRYGHDDAWLIAFGIGTPVAALLTLSMMKAIHDEWTQWRDDVKQLRDTRRG